MLCTCAYGFLVPEYCAVSPLASSAAKASARHVTSGPGSPEIKLERNKPTSVANLRLILNRLLIHPPVHYPYGHRSPRNPDVAFLGQYQLAAPTADCRLPAYSSISPYPNSIGITYTLVVILRACLTPFLFRVEAARHGRCDDVPQLLIRSDRSLSCNSP
jgi:hypothetical protein